MLVKPEETAQRLIAGVRGDLMKAEKRTLREIRCLPLTSPWLPHYRGVLQFVREARP